MTAVLRELSAAPAMRPLLAKAALASIGRDGSGELPSTVYALSDVPVSVDELAAYDRVCGFRLGNELPPTYPHLLGFGLQMKLMTDRDFPFAPIGTVHVANRITVHRPLSVHDRLELRVRAQNLRSHPKGQRFDVLLETYVDGELVWHETSTYLRRGAVDESTSDEMTERPKPDNLEPSAAWRVPDDVGRRYAQVSGDANPIHLYRITAKLFGFPRAIAHGMWSKARCLATLGAALPEAYTVDVTFRKPVLLPSSVTFGTAVRGGVREFALRRARDGQPHLLGSIRAE